jgi:DNA-binding transcriptional ArsR family regulator
MSSPHHNLAQGVLRDHWARDVVSGDGPVDWAVLIPRLVHPTKVLVIEAMLWIDRPMSAVEFARIFDTTVTLSSVSYHVKKLADDGVLEPVLSRKRRGAIETYFYFAVSVIQCDPTLCVNQSRKKGRR